MEPVQHAWPSPPQGGDWQVPPMHTSKPAQVPPAQHIWPDIPHMGAAWQVPDMHTSEPVQVLPAQHIWPEAPHMAVGIPQLPAVHTSPMLQSEPTQQG